MEKGSGDSREGSLLGSILYSSTLSTPAVIDDIASTATTASSTSSEELTSTALSLLDEEDYDSLLVSNISSTISSLTSLGDKSDSEIFADKIAGDYDVTSPLRVPKYFQAIITLFVCAMLLLCTLGIIKQVRLLCHKSSCHAANKIPLIRVHSGKDGHEDEDMDSVLVEKNGGGKDNKSHGNSGDPMKPGDRHFDYYSQNIQPKELTSPTNGATGDNEDLLMPKKVRFVRRVSGPFSDEAMDFAGATYKTDKETPKYLSKEKSRSSKKMEPQIKFTSMRKASQPTIPPASLPTPPPLVLPPRPQAAMPPRSSSPGPPPPPRSSPPPL